MKKHVALWLTCAGHQAQVLSRIVWRDEASNDGGKTWKLQSEYQMKRRRAN